MEIRATPNKATPRHQGETSTSSPKATEKSEDSSHVVCRSPPALRQGHSAMATAAVRVKTSPKPKIFAMYSLSKPGTELMEQEASGSSFCRLGFWWDLSSTQNSAKDASQAQVG